MLMQPICRRLEPFQTRLGWWLFGLSLLAALAMNPPTAWGCAACGGFGSDIYVRTHAEVQGDVLVRLDVQWQLTEMLAHTLFTQYDTDRDGRLDAAEERALVAFFTEDLRRANYLTTLTINGRQVTAPRFENPHLEWQPTRAQFSYSLPLQQPIEDMLELTLQLTDPDHYFMFYYFNDSVAWNAPPGYQISDNTVWFPQVLEISIQSDSAAASPASATTQKNAVSQAPPADSPGARLLQNFGYLLQSIHTRLNTHLHAVKTGGSVTAALLLIVFAFLYGLLHAAGPGHGKSLVASYFISHHHRVKKALAMALMIGAVHVFSAFILTVSVLLLLNLFFTAAMQQATLVLTRISGILIILIAAYLVYQKIRAARHAAACASPASPFPLAPARLPTCGCTACHATSHPTDVLLVISAGAIPCPGTVTVFLFAISMQLYLVGFLAAAAMSLGMGLVIFSVAWVSITSRNHLAGRFTHFTRLLEYASVGVILVLGVLLLLVKTG